jgi:PAS domain S-box-containing protein
MVVLRVVWTGGHWASLGVHEMSVFVVPRLNASRAMAETSQGQWLPCVVEHEQAPGRRALTDARQAIERFLDWRSSSLTNDPRAMDDPHLAPVTDIPPQQILDLIQDRIEVIGPDGRVLAANEVSEDFFSSVNMPLVGSTWLSYWGDEERSSTRRAFQLALSGQTRRFTAPMAPVDGSDARCWATTLGPLCNEQGVVEAVVAVSRDITDRIHAEGSLRAINEALRLDVSALRQAHAEERAHAGALARRLARVAAGLDDEDETPQADDATQDLQRRESELQDELDLAMAAQRIAEQVSRQAQKGAAIGQLVSGIAHDFNNMLQVIQMTLDMLTLQSNLDERQQRLVGRSQEAVGHATALAARLLAFGREHPYQAELLDLGEVVQGMVALIQHGLGPRMEVQLTPAASAMPIRSDRHSIEQALMNLCVNARDACDGRGCIKITFGEHMVMATQGSPMQAPGSYAYVEVRDDGCGMDMATRERIFEPFFTTKPEGKGSGLGMAQVFGLMRQSEGLVTVESVLDEGTTVRLLFPRTGAE